MMERDTTEFRIKFVNDDKDLLVRVPSASTFSVVVAQVRSQDMLPFGTPVRVRVICSKLFLTSSLYV